MLRHVAWTHTPENCPKDVGSSKTLYDPKVRCDVVQQPQSRCARMPTWAEAFWPSASSTRSTTV